MSDPTQCQWCGASVKLRFCRPDTDVHQMLVFACDVEWYAEEGDNAWPRRAPLKCGQRCAEQMRRLREARNKSVQLAIDSVTEGAE
jgi:hypothetical protein